MKSITIEVEDSIFQSLEKVWGEDADISAILSDILKEGIVMMATHPEDFFAAFGPNAQINQPPLVQKSLAKIRKKHLPWIDNDGLEEK